MKDIPESITPSQWKRLSLREKQFIRDADNGGMRCLVLDGGRVCAWGIAVAGIFSMEVKIDKNEFDGYVVTLP
jgi:hypothetical protein